MSKNIWDNEKGLVTLEQKRDIKKSMNHNKRQTFDCFNAIAIGERVNCKAGHPLADTPDGSAHLLTVLKGICYATCKGCNDFNG